MNENSPDAQSATVNSAPSVIAIWQDSPYAKWMCPSSADVDDSPWSGYLDIDADAHTGTVLIGETPLTPAEARSYAQAVTAAADHAEQFHRRAADALWNLICHWPELSDLPVETQRAVRDRLREAEKQVRDGHTWRGETVTVTADLDDAGPVAS